MVILFSFPLLASEMARRSTVQVRTATIGHVLSTRRLTGTTWASIHRATTHRATAAGTTASLFALFSNLSTKREKQNKTLQHRMQITTFPQRKVLHLMVNVLNKTTLLNYKKK